MPDSDQETKFTDPLENYRKSQAEVAEREFGSLMGSASMRVESGVDTRETKDVVLEYKGFLDNATIILAGSLSDYADDKELLDSQIGNLKSLAMAENATFNTLPPESEYQQNNATAISFLGKMISKRFESNPVPKSSEKIAKIVTAVSGQWEKALFDDYQTRASAGKK